MSSFIAGQSSAAVLSSSSGAVVSGSSSITASGGAGTTGVSFIDFSSKLLRLYQQSVKTARHSTLRGGGGGNSNANGENGSDDEDEEEDGDDVDDDNSSSSPHSAFSAGSAARRRRRRRQQRRRRNNSGNKAPGDFFDDDDNNDDDFVDDEGDLTKVEDIDAVLHAQQQRRSQAEKIMMDVQSKLLNTGADDKPESNPDGGDTALLQDILRRTHGAASMLRRAQNRKQQRSAAGKRGSGGGAKSDTSDDSDLNEHDSDVDDHASPSATANDAQNSHHHHAGGGGGGGGKSGSNKKSEPNSSATIKESLFLPSILRSTKVDFSKAAQEAQHAAQAIMDNRKSLANDARFILRGAVHNSHDAVKKFQAYAAGADVMQPRPPLPTLPDVNCSHSHKARGGTAGALANNNNNNNNNGPQTARNGKKGPSAPSVSSSPRWMTARNNNNNTAGSAASEARDKAIQYLFMTECRTPATGALNGIAVSDHHHHHHHHHHHSPLSSNASRGQQQQQQQSPRQDVAYGSLGMPSNMGDLSTTANSNASGSGASVVGGGGGAENPLQQHALLSASGGVGGDAAPASPASAYGGLYRHNSTNRGPTSAGGGGPGGGGGIHSVEELLAFDPHRGADRHHQSYRSCRTIQPRIPHLKVKLGAARKCERFIQEVKESAVVHGRHGVGELRRAWEAQQQFRDERKRVMNEVLDNPRLQFVAPQALLQQVRSRMKTAAATKDHKERLNYYFEHIRNVRPHIDILFPKSFHTSQVLLDEQLAAHDVRSKQHGKKGGDDDDADDVNSLSATSDIMGQPAALVSGTASLPDAPTRDGNKFTARQPRPKKPEQQQQQPVDGESGPTSTCTALNSNNSNHPGSNQHLVDECTLAHHFLDELQKTIVERDGVSSLSQLDEVFLSVFSDEHVHLEHVTNLLALVAPLFGANEQQFVEWIRAKRKLHEHRDKAVIVAVAQSEYGDANRTDCIDANFTLTVNSVRGAWTVGGYAGGAAETAGKRSPPPLVSSPLSPPLQQQQQQQQSASASARSGVGGKPRSGSVTVASTGGGLGASRRAKVCLRFRAENNGLIITTSRVPVRAAVWQDATYNVRLMDQRSDISVELLNDADGTVIATGSMTVHGLGWKRPHALQIELVGLGRGVASVVVEMEFPNCIGPALKRKLAVGHMMGNKVGSGSAVANGVGSPAPVPPPAIAPSPTKS